MKITVEFDYYKSQPRWSNVPFLEYGDMHTSPGEVAEQIRDVLMTLMENEHVSGRISITVETGEE